MGRAKGAAGEGVGVDLLCGGTCTVCDELQHNIGIQAVQGQKYNVEAAAAPA